MVELAALGISQPQLIKELTGMGLEVLGEGTYTYDGSVKIACTNAEDHGVRSKLLAKNLKEDCSPISCEGPKD
jgi:hypothetical protein